MTANELLALAVGLLTAMSLSVALLGLGVRYILSPWLQANLIAPLLAKVDNLNAEVRVAAGMFEGHISRSGDEWTRMWDAITDLNKGRTDLWAAVRDHERQHHQ